MEGGEASAPQSDAAKPSAGTSEAKQNAPLSSRSKNARGAEALERRTSDGDKFTLQLDTKPLGELHESRVELLSRVQNLKKDLQDWRGKLDGQVKVYRQELGELRNTLNTEVEQLRVEFQDLRATLRKTLDSTKDLASPEGPSDTLASQDSGEAAEE